MGRKADQRGDQNTRDNAWRLKKRLDQKEFSEGCRLSEAEMQVLDDIGSGKPPRNAAAIVTTLMWKAGFAYSKPKQEIEVSGKLDLVDALSAARARANKKSETPGE